MKIKKILSFAFFIILCFSFDAPSFAQEKLTVADAVILAAGRSSELFNLFWDEYVLELNRDVLFENSMDAVTSIQIIESAMALIQNDLHRASLMSGTALQRQLIEFSIISYFASITAAERDFEAFDVNLRLSERRLEISRVKFELGIISESSYESAVNNHNRLMDNREDKLIAINNAYRKLNRVIGRDLDRRYSVILDITFRPLRDRNLNGHISSRVSQSHIIRERERELRLAQANLDLFIGPGTIYESEIMVSQANRALNDARYDLSERIRVLYSEIREMELQYGLRLIDLENMLKQLEILEIRYELGMVTRLDVDVYRHQIMEFENSILRLVNNHYLKVMQFENPDLL